MEYGVIYFLNQYLQVMKLMQIISEGNMVDMVYIDFNMALDMVRSRRHEVFKVYLQTGSKIGLTIGGRG